MTHTCACSLGSMGQPEGRGGGRGRARGRGSGGYGRDHETSVVMGVYSTRF